MADDDTKADEKKPLDRLKPFRRINNDAAVPAAKLDGLGKPCGCQVPGDFGKFEDEFLKALDDEAPAFATILKVIKKAKDIAEAVGNAIKASTAVAAIVQALTGLGLAAALIQIAAIVAVVNKIIEIVTTALDIALRRFLARLAAKLFPRAIRVMPQWVPVKRGEAKARVTPAQVVEVEGVVTRSFGNPIDVPFAQWHRWFSWNVQVTPEPKYRNVLSPAADPPNTRGALGSERSLFKDGCFEIQWDAGALWHPGSTQAGALTSGFGELGKENPNDPFAAQGIQDNDGPMMLRDLCWPTTGMFVWAAGRHVYDCSRATVDTKGEDEKDPKMVAMLNPCKAIATARFTAFKFLQNEFSVPAIQFMFFTTKRGGYIDYDTISDQDYEFILDLPPIDPAPPTPFPIGQEKRSVHNTILVRPRLLHQIEKANFADTTNADEAPNPLIEVIRPEDPSKPPTQVKIKVPCTTIGAKQTYGFILSLGWHDPLLDQARKVRECKVTVNAFSGRLQIRDSGLKKIREIFKDEEAELRKEVAKAVLAQIDLLPIPLGLKLSSIPGVNTLIERMIEAGLKGFFDLLQEVAPLEKEEWLLRVCVNGRWQNVFVNGVGSAVADVTLPGNVRPVALPRPLVFDAIRVGEKDSLLISAHGMEFDPVGDMMRSGTDNRTLRLDGAPVSWATICDPAGDAAAVTQIRRRLALRYVIKCLTDTTTGRPALGLENSPLGIVDPDAGRSGPSPVSNPLEIEGAEDGFNDGRQSARFARALGDQMILVEDTSKDDYRILYTVEIKKQVN